MAKETNFLSDEQMEGIRKANIMQDKAIDDALSDIKKATEKDQAEDAKNAFCGITYYIGKEVASKRKRHREDEIQSDKLKALKKLFERFIGFECDIKDGQLVPDKKKPIKAEERLTSAQLKCKRRDLSDEINKKIRESDKTYNQEIEELRGSYIGQHGRWYSSDWEV